jgi:hypothetical protein
MQVQFNSDSSVMGTENVAERIEASVREKLARFEERLTRIEIHVRDENGAMPRARRRRRSASGSNGTSARNPSTATTRGPIRCCKR